MDARHKAGHDDSGLQGGTVATTFLSPGQPRLIWDGGHDYCCGSGVPDVSVVAEGVVIDCLIVMRVVQKGLA